MVPRASDRREQSRGFVGCISAPPPKTYGGGAHIYSQDLGESNILRCADDSLYIGSAQDLDARVKAHNEGRGAAYTFKHRPVRLVYSQSFGSEDAALTRERQLKRWSRGKKEALIKGDLERLKRLSKRCS